MRRLVFVLAVVISLTAGLTSPALGQSSSQDELSVFVYFPAPDNPIPIYDLGGTLVGEGSHQGQLRCIKRSCNQKTELVVNDVEYRYRFDTKLAIDPLNERVVVGGTGSISSHGQAEKFSFTVTLQNNQNGTVRVQYSASRPDASFVLPAASGIFIIFGGN